MIDSIIWAVLGWAGKRAFDAGISNIFEASEREAYAALKRKLYPTIGCQFGGADFGPPRSIVVPEPILTIGSAPSANLRIPNLPPVWGHIVVADNAFLIHQVAETGARLSVNGQPAIRHYLRHGDLLTVGATPMFFNLASRGTIEALAPGTFANLGIDTPIPTPGYRSASPRRPAPTQNLARNQSPMKIGTQTGTVKWFNADKGYGFITSDDGIDLFVHYSFIQADGYRALEEGQRVTFTVGSNSHGPQAECVYTI